MEYLNIIEENFAKSDYVAYLRGSILMCLLEDKPFDTTQFKLYADKLVEVLEKQQADTIGTGCSCLQTQAPEPTVDTDEPKVQPKTLKKDTWYHTKDFTLEELKELLPKGTTILVEKPVLYDGIETTPPTETRTTTVENITTSFLTEEPLIETTSGTFLKEWFKIVED